MQAAVHPLRRLRERASLSVGDMGALVGVSSDEVIRAEQGPRLVEPELLARYAVALGMSERDVLMGEEPGAVALLFRSMRERGASPGPLVRSGQETLGDFVRCVRDVGRLRRSLGEAPEGPPAWLGELRPAPLPAKTELHEQARRLAAELREYLGLGPDECVASMRALIGRLGIVTMFVEPEQLDPQIDGAALLDPYPAILVNLVGGGDKWWRTRMTLAHELCHLLHDRLALDPLRPGRFFLFSPFKPDHARTPNWQLTERFEEIEVRANAFAGDFLAPTQGVCRLVGDDDPTAIATIQRICAHFMIGPTTAVNRLQNTFGLSREQRGHMDSRVRLAAAAGDFAAILRSGHDDQLPTGVQLRDHDFVELVLRACASGHIDAIAAREHLNLRPSDPLPRHPALPIARGEPLVTAEQRAHAAALRYLIARTGGWSHAVGACRPDREGWLASVYRRDAAGRPSACGELRLDADLRVAEPVDWLP